MGTNGAGGSTWTVTCIHCDYKATGLAGQEKDVAVAAHEGQHDGHTCAAVLIVPDEGR
jgi:hypothetical protein